MSKTSSESSLKIIKEFIFPIFTMILTLLIFSIELKCSNENISEEIRKKFESERETETKYMLFTTLLKLRDEFKLICTISDTSNLFSINSDSTLKKISLKNMDSLLSVGTDLSTLYCTIFIQDEGATDSIKKYTRDVSNLSNKLRNNQLVRITFQKPSLEIFKEMSTNAEKSFECTKKQLQKN